MMKYRYIYDYLFIPNEEITVGDKVITDLMIYVKFKVYHNGEEVFFDNDKGVSLLIDGHSASEHRKISIEHILFIGLFYPLVIKPMKRMLRGAVKPKF